MLKLFRYALILLSIIFIFGCGSSKPGQNIKMINIQQYQSASENGVLYIVRKPSIGASLIKASYTIENTYIGTLASENKPTYYVVELSPGTYNFKETFYRDFLPERLSYPLKVSPGQKYMFIRKGGSFRRFMPFDENAFKNSKFIGYTKISK